jgi:hypothetical protein
MNQADTQITDTAYDPDDELRDLLDDLATVRVSYGSDHEIDLPGELTALQRDYEMVFVEDGDEFTLSGTETTGSLGMFLSLEGNLGFAAGIVLQHALILGEPTQCYTDETVPSDPSLGRYQDLTAEWYQPAAVEQGIHEARLSNRAVDLRATGLSLDEIERYGRHWLSL